MSCGVLPVFRTVGVARKNIFYYIILTQRSADCSIILILFLWDQSKHHGITTKREDSQGMASKKSYYLFCMAYVKHLGDAISWWWHWSYQVCASTWMHSTCWGNSVCQMHGILHDKQVLGLWLCLCCRLGILPKVDSTALLHIILLTFSRNHLKIYNSFPLV